MQEAAVIYFDGVCNLCNRAAQQIIRNDKRNLYRFASLQSEAGRQFLTKNNLSPSELTTFYLVENNKIYSRSDAALRIAKNSGWKYSWLYFFKVIPRPLRDVVYDWISKRRYRWFGKREECWLPTEELREKFL